MDSLWILVWIFGAVAAVSAVILSRLSWIIYRTSDVARLGYALPSLVNIYVLAAYALVALESSPFQNTISDYGAPLSFMYMILVVPIATIASFVFGRKRPLERPQKSYLRWSRALWALQLAPSSEFWFFLYAWASGR